jgi:hypothetical protein
MRKENPRLSHIPPGRYDLLAATPSVDYAVTQIATNASRAMAIRWKSARVRRSRAPSPSIAGSGRVHGIAKRSGKGIAGA